MLPGPQMKECTNTATQTNSHKKIIAGAMGATTADCGLEAHAKEHPMQRLTMLNCNTWDFLHRLMNLDET